MLATRQLSAERMHVATQTFSDRSPICIRKKKMVQSSGTVGNEIVYSLLFRVHAYQNHSKHTRTHVWSRALAHTHTHCQCILYRVYSTRSKQTTLKQNKKNLGTDTNRAEVMRVQIAWPIDNYWSR